jgi:hypothetical protein
MGAAGLRIVGERFDHRDGVRRIAALFAADGLAPAPEDAPEDADDGAIRRTA